MENRENFDSLSELLIIDRDQLDQELIEQSHYYMQISSKLAQAMEERDKLKDQVKILESSEGTRFRNLLHEESGKKPTESAVLECVKQSQRVIEAQNVHREMSRVVQDWQNLRDAWTQRSHSLKSLCDLYSADYFPSKSASKI